MSGGPSNEPAPRDRWNARYRSQTEPAGPPHALQSMAHLLPDSGLAVDLAGGDGAGAEFLARHGLTPVVVEVSDVALDLARNRIMPGGHQLTAVEHDLGTSTLEQALDAVFDQWREQAPGDGSERDGQPPPVTVVSCFHYLQRRLLASVAADLPPGAGFYCAIATTTNLERNERPSRRFLLEPGELSSLVLGSRPDGPGDIEVLCDHEGWNDRNQHEAQLAVRKLG